MTTERFCVRNVRYDDLSVICALEEQCFAVAWTMDDFELFCGEVLVAAGKNGLAQLEHLLKVLRIVHLRSPFHAVMVSG